MSTINKQLNLVLSSGLLVLNAKIHNGLATCFVTDLVGNTRIVIDLESKKLLTNRDGIEVNVDDLNKLVTELVKK